MERPRFTTVVLVFILVLTTSACCQLKNSSDDISKVVLRGPNGISLFATMHPSRREIEDASILGGNVVRIWKRKGNHRLLLKEYKGSDPGLSGYDRPESFRLNGEYFIHVALSKLKTGNIHDDNILWIAPDATLHDVIFLAPAGAYQDTLGKGEGVLEGVEDYSFSDENATFVFGAWTESDGVCTVRGHFKLVGQKHLDENTNQWSANFSIVPADFKREKPVRVHN